MTLSFAESLRKEAGHIWEAIFSHPFLRDLQAGALPLESFRYYIIQDYHYLEGFARTVSIALSRAPDSEALRRLARRVTTPVERPFHTRLFDLLKIDVSEATKTPMAPTNLAYVNHMLTSASTGGVGEAAAALLPCPWTYHEIGARLSPTDHPVYGQWISVYASGLLAESAAAWRELVDQAAADGGPTLRDSMRRAFMTSSRYEHLFWTMAYKREQWPA